MRQFYNSENNEINFALLQMAIPIFAHMPIYFGSDTFDIATVKNILRARNCPEHLLDEVIDNSIKGGIIEYTQGKKFIKVIVIPYNLSD